MNKYAELSRAVSVSVSEIKYRSCDKKATFETEEEAHDFNKGQRPYKCLFCDGWHLTAGIPKLLKRLRHITPEERQEADRKARDGVLWRMVNGWELREFFADGGHIHWRLVKVPGKSTLDVRAALKNLIEPFIYSDEHLHDNRYRIYQLTKKGAKRAAKITEADFL